MNIFEQGTLAQDIPNTPINHYDYTKQEDAVHSLIVSESRYLADGTYHINSIHHQAVDVLGKNIKATGQSPDGVIEMIEHQQLPWLGVQWHPEFKFPNPGFKEIYKILDT